MARIGPSSLLALCAISAAPGAELRGELESTLGIFEVADTTWSQQSARARAYLRHDLGASARLELGFAATNHFGKTSLRLLDLLPPGYQASFDSLATALFGDDQRAEEGFPLLFTASNALGQMPLFDSIDLDRALITWHGPGFSIEIGRQPLAWGAGYAWNPTNVFDRKSLLEPTREPRGLDALRIRGGGRVRFEALLRADDTPAETACALRLGGSAWGWEANLLAARQRWRRMDWEHWSEPDTSRGAPVLEWEGQAPYLVVFNQEVERITLGGDLRGELWGVGCWAEAAWNRLDAGKNFWDATAGVDHLFDFQTYLLLELHLEGEGRDDPADYSLNDWMKTLTGERGGLGRTYGFAALNHPLGELTELSALGYANLSDRGLWTECALERSLADDLLLTLALDLPFADQGDELGRFGPGGFVRFVAYF